MFTKEQLEQMYQTMSVEDMAKNLGIAKSTLYYHMRKLGVVLRSKSDAQKQHLTSGPHQRAGQKHSSEAKERISLGTQKFWESTQGQEQKSRLGDLRRQEWQNSSTSEKQGILGRLQSAIRPAPGSLSKFGFKLAYFIAEHEPVTTGIKLTPNHVSDIILEDRKIVLELILPTRIYGDQQEQKTKSRYERIVSDLNQVGYRVVVIEDKSNSLSMARCRRVYEQLQAFYASSEASIYLIS